MAGLPAVERPIDPNNPALEAQRKAQVDRFLRGELIFPGQRFDSAEDLEAALARVMASHPWLPEKRADEDPDALRRARVALGLEME